MTSPNLHVSLQDERAEYVTLQENTLPLSVCKRLPTFYQIASVLVICWCSWSVYLVLVVCMHFDPRNWGRELLMFLLMFIFQ